MDKRFKHPWFQVLADIKKKAADAGLTEKETIELPQMIIGEINKEIKPRGRKRPFYLAERFVHAHVYEIPIIQPRAFEIFIGQLEPERFDEVKHAARCGAGTGDIPRVLRDFRFD